MSNTDRKEAAALVSSAHLVSARLPALSEFEFALHMLANAYYRWIVRSMAAAGYSDLSALDVQILHLVNHRDREKRASDIGFLLNIDDNHIVIYALKKLVRLQLLASRKQGKESVYSTTDTGKQACQKYRDVREACLIDNLAAGDIGDELRQAAALMRMLSGQYDQAARAATSL